MTLKELCDVRSVSGCESQIINLLYEYVQHLSLDDIYIDNVGNLICVSKGTDGRHKIMVTAHVDEVGFQVIKPLGDRKFRIKPVGFVNSKYAIGEEVVSENSTGVVLSSEVSVDSYDYEKLYLEATKTNEIAIGSVFSFKPSYYELDDYYISKALDNRAGCYCVLKQMEKNHAHVSDIFYVFTVQEETSLRGCRVARTSIKPDYYINVDTTPIHPMSSVVLGMGAAIKISDGYVIANDDDVKYISKLGKDNNCVFQYEVNDFGLNETIITNETDNGCHILGISIPCDDMHSAKTRVHKADVLQTTNLLDSVLCNL